MNEANVHDVVIVGGGFAGLSAAHALAAAGVDFVLLEARDRVGGRVESVVNGLGERVDTGGQFLCDDMPELVALARSRGKALKPAFIDGDFIAQPAMSDEEAGRTYAGSEAIRARMNTIDPRDPAIAGLSVSDWLAMQHDHRDSKAAFRAMIEGLWCLSVERLPLWHLVDNDRRITNQVSELQYFLEGTMHALADDLAGDLGARVRRQTGVTGIAHGPDGVRVQTGHGTLAARCVIVAMPPSMAARLSFAPALPPPLARALSVWESGSVIKLQIRYARAFWRERGQSGMVAWREPSGLFAFDTSPDTEHTMLTFFIGGPLARIMRDKGEDAIRQDAVARLVAALGPEAGEFEDMLLRDWTDDRWSGGAYSDLIVDMHATNAEDLLRQGLPRVVFAASELSPSFPGYIEGAIVAGRHAGRKVIAALKGSLR